MVTTATRASAQSIEQSKSNRKFCTFWVSDRQFGVDILDVKEVNRESSFTPIYHAPAEVRGYVNIRGQIYLILDLRKLLGLGSAVAERASRLVLFKPSVGESFGVLVDKVGDVISVEDGAIEDRRGSGQTLPETGDRRCDRDDLTSGVCKLQDSLLVILNARNLLTQVEKVRES